MFRFIQIIITLKNNPTTQPTMKKKPLLLNKELTNK